MSLYRLALIALLTLSLLNPLVIAGGIVVDGSNGHKATMDTTANGIPLINIATPNGSGLSHNQFTTFNIAPAGVVFNNALKATQTQLGGWVQGNANLGVTPARVILNEVTGTSRSLLQGYGEVAGTAADVIVANPNGITVNGGGFINTPHATLTTGVPDVTNGNLNGFTVQRGDVLIEGSGFNGTNIDRVDLYTKALQLNGNMYASTLNVVTGSNHITPEGVITPLNMIPQTGVSIDSNALGGIYANTIVLVGTDKGVGVNLPQTTYASNSLHLSADGHITLGSVYATNSMTITSQSNDITLTHELSTADVTLNASKGITNLGSLQAQKASLKANHFTNNGTMLSDTALILTDQTLTNTGTLQAQTQLNIHSLNLFNDTTGNIIAPTLSLEEESSLTNLGSIQSNTLTLKAKGFTNRGDVLMDTGTITLSEAFDNSGTVSGSTTVKALSLTNSGIMESKTLEMILDNDLINQGSITANDFLLTLKNLTNSGSMVGAAMGLTTLQAIHNTGILSLSDTLTLHADTLLNDSLSTLEATTLHANVDTQTTNNGTIKGTTLSLATPTLTNTGTLLAQTLTLEGTDITNNALFQGDSTTTITTTHSLTNNGGIIEKRGQATFMIGNCTTIRINSMFWNRERSRKDENVQKSSLSPFPLSPFPSRPSFREEVYV